MVRCSSSFFHFSKNVAVYLRVFSHHENTLLPFIVSVYFCFPIFECTLDCLGICTYIACVCVMFRFRQIFGATSPARSGASQVSPVRDSAYELQHTVAHFLTNHFCSTAKRKVRVEYALISLVLLLRETCEICILIVPPLFPLRPASIAPHLSSPSRSRHLDPDRD